MVRGWGSSGTEFGSCREETRQLQSLVFCCEVQGGKSLLGEQRPISQAWWSWNVLSVCSSLIYSQHTISSESQGRLHGRMMSSRGVESPLNSSRSFTFVVRDSRQEISHPHKNAQMIECMSSPSGEKTASNFASNSGRLASGSADSVASAMMWTGEGETEGEG